MSAVITHTATVTDPEAPPPPNGLCRELRDSIVDEQLKDVKGHDKGLLKDGLNHKTCQEYISELYEKYEGHPEAKFLLAIQPAVEGLKVFETPITGLLKNVPVGPNIWAATQVLLESARESYRVLSHITKFIKGFTKDLPRYKDYAEMFPDFPRLHEGFCDIYVAYVQTCLQAAIYLQRRPSVNSSRVMYLLCRDSLNFDKAMDKLKDCEAIFNHEALFAHIKTSGGLQKAKERRLDVTILPFGRNLDFYPRDDLLQKIKEHLYPVNPESSDGSQSCVVHRMCGVGKTQLSLEFAYRFGCGSPVFWVQAETSTSVAEAFGRMAKALNLDADADKAEWSSLTNLARNWLSKSTHWLVIFDNAPDFETIEEYWPRATHGSVIVTTRNKNLLPPDALSIYLPPMTRGDGAKLLLNHLRPMIGDDAPKYSTQAAENISDELEGLPLAISHVAGYIRRSNRPSRDLLNDLKDHDQVTAIWSGDFGTSTTQQYGRRFDKAWAASLSNLSDGARSLLGVIALIKIKNCTEVLPEELPERMFLGQTNDDLVAFGQMRNELLGHHLLREQSGAHTLSLRRFAKESMVLFLKENPEVLKRARKRATEAVEGYKSDSPVFYVDRLDK